MKNAETLFQGDMSRTVKTGWMLAARSMDWNTARKMSGWSAQQCHLSLILIWTYLIMFNTKRNALFSVFQNLPFKFIQIWSLPKEEKKNPVILQFPSQNFCCLCWQREKYDFCSSCNSRFYLNRNQRLREQLWSCKMYLSASLSIELVSLNILQDITFFFHFSSSFFLLHYFSTGKKCQIC